MFFGRIAAAITGLAIALATAPTTALADDEEDARVHFEQGVALYESGDFEQAAIAFARAYELKPSYKLLFNIGQAEAELKHYARALEAFTRYLAEGGDAVPPERGTEVKSEIKRLNALVGMIEIVSQVEGAKIKIDNESKGETPLTGPIFVDIGKHEVVVKKGQDELLREVVRIAGGQRLTLEVEGLGGAAQGTGDAPAEPEDEGGGRVWTWVALGVGGAAGIAGGAIGGAAMSKKSQLDDKCEGNHCPSSTEGDADTVKTMSLTADVLFGVAGAAIITGVILFFVEPDDESEVEVAVTPAVTASGAGLAVGGRF
jgi:hypothetical protein